MGMGYESSRAPVLDSRKSKQLKFKKKKYFVSNRTLNFHLILICEGPKELKLFVLLVSNYFYYVVVVYGRIFDNSQKNKLFFFASS